MNARTLQLAVALGATALLALASSARAAEIRVACYSDGNECEVTQDREDGVWHRTLSYFRAPIHCGIVKTSILSSGLYCSTTRSLDSGKSRLAQCVASRRMVSRS